MKFILVLTLATTSAFAQNPAPLAQNACGPEKDVVRGDAGLHEAHSGLAQPEAGKAVVYFIQDEPGLPSHG